MKRYTTVEGNAWENISLRIYESDSKELWAMFRSHHYLSKDMNKACKFYLCYWEDTLVAMISVISMPSGTVKYAYRGHRYVVLPDYQGIGIGTKLANFFAEYFIQNGYKYFVRASHIRIKDNMEHILAWRPTSHNNLKRSQKQIDRCIEKRDRKEQHSGIIGDRRICGSFEYMGWDWVNKPHKIIKADYYDGFDVDGFTNYILKLKEDYYVSVVTGIPAEENPIEKSMREHGVRTEQMYYRKNGVLLENGKYKNTEVYEEEL